MARVGRAHHVLGVPHLLRQLGHRQRAVLLGAAAGQRREADHEEVQAREGDQVDRQLAQVRVQLACLGSTRTARPHMQQARPACRLTARRRCTMPETLKAEAKAMGASAVTAAAHNQGDPAAVLAARLHPQAARPAPCSLLTCTTGSIRVQGFSFGKGRARTGEAQAAGDAGHDGGDEVVEVAEGGRGQLERAEADVVQRLVVQDHALVRVLNQLVHAQRRVVGLDHRVGHLGRGHDREGLRAQPNQAPLGTSTTPQPLLPVETYSAELVDALAGGSQRHACRCIPCVPCEHCRQHKRAPGKPEQAGAPSCAHASLQTCSRPARFASPVPQDRF